MLTSDQETICGTVGVVPVPVDDWEKAGVALATLHLRPLNGMRIRGEKGTSGWYVWGGEELSQDPGFFQPVHHAHIPAKCPLVQRYFALPSGWHFLATESYEDVWYDDQLLVERD